MKSCGCTTINYIGIKKKLYKLFANLPQTGDSLCTSHARQTELCLDAFQTRASCLSNAGRQEKARTHELRRNSIIINNNKSHNGTTWYYQKQEKENDSTLHNNSA